MFMPSYETWSQSELVDCAGQRGFPFRSSPSDPFIELGATDENLAAGHPVAGECLGGWLVDEGAQRADGEVGVLRERAQTQVRVQERADDDLLGQDASLCDPNQLSTLAAHTGHIPGPQQRATGRNRIEESS